jgi:hypothetical protein
MRCVDVAVWGRCVRVTWPLSWRCCRHGVLVTVLRPWYTFDIIAYASFILQTVTDESEVAASLEWQSPDEKDVEDADASAGAGAGESKTEAAVDTTSHHVLVIPDCHGICEFDFIKPTYACRLRAGTTRRRVSLVACVLCDALQVLYR